MSERYNPKLPPCCRYYHWQHGAAWGDLNRAAKWAARYPSPKNIETVTKMREADDHATTLAEEVS